MHEEFPPLVEQVRQLTNAVGDRAKAVLQRVLPGVTALQQGNASFSPRLMSLMLSRAAGRLPPADHAALGAALQYAEQFQPTLTGWLVASRNPAGPGGSTADRQQCRQAVQALTQHLSSLDGVLSRVARGEPGAT